MIETTTNNNYLLQIPKTKLKYAKNEFFSKGVTLYNKLLTKTRKNGKNYF